MKHTKGDWSVFDSDVTGLSVNADNECKRICDVARNPKDDDYANAVLIAAVPVMLKALKEIKRNLIANGDARPLLFGALAMAEKAIAVAEGQFDVKTKHRCTKRLDGSSCDFPECVESVKVGEAK